MSVRCVPRRLLLDHKYETVADAAAESLNVIIGYGQAAAGVSSDVHRAIRADSHAGRHGSAGSAEKAGEQQR